MCCLAEGLSMIPNKEKDNRQRHRSCQEGHGQRDCWVNERAIPGVQSHKNHQHENGEHSPKIELVHHLLCVMAPARIQVKGGCVAKQVEKHEGYSLKWSQLATRLQSPHQTTLTNTFYILDGTIKQHLLFSKQQSENTLPSNLPNQWSGAIR